MPSSAEIHSYSWLPIQGRAEFEFLQASEIARLTTGVLFSPKADRIRVYAVPSASLGPRSHRFNRFEFAPAQVRPYIGTHTLSFDWSQV